MTYHSLRGRARYPSLVYLRKNRYLSLKNCVATVFDTNTSFSVTVPSYVIAGDLLVINLFTRDTLTPPSGWTLAKSESVSSPTTQQTSYMYYKNASLSDAGSTVSFTQATSQRYGIQLVVISTGSPYGATLESAVSNSSGTIATQPAQTSLKSGNIAVGSMSIITMSSGSAFLYKNNWTPMEIVTGELLRLCGGVCPVGVGSVPPWTFSNGISASNTIAICSVFTPKLQE